MCATWGEGIEKAAGGEELPAVTTGGNNVGCGIAPRHWQVEDKIGRDTSLGGTGRSCGGVYTIAGSKDPPGDIVQQGRHSSDPMSPGAAAGNVQCRHDSAGSCGTGRVCWDGTISCTGHSRVVIWTIRGSRLAHAGGTYARRVQSAQACCAVAWRGDGRGRCRCNPVGARPL